MVVYLQLLQEEQEMTLPVSPPQGKTEEMVEMVLDVKAGGVELQLQVHQEANPPSGNGPGGAGQQVFQEVLIFFNATGNHQLQRAGGTGGGTDGYGNGTSWWFRNSKHRWWRRWRQEFTTQVLLMQEQLDQEWWIRYKFQ